MARIDPKKIQKLDKDRNTVHNRVAATYSVFTIDGNRYVQIDTYGNSDRIMPEKISQSFQLDHESAKFLCELLRKEFNL